MEFDATAFRQPPDQQFSGFTEPGTSRGLVEIRFLTHPPQDFGSVGLRLPIGDSAAGNPRILTLKKAIFRH